MKRFQAIITKKKEIYFYDSKHLGKQRKGRKDLKWRKQVRFLIKKT